MHSLLLSYLWTGVVNSIFDNLKKPNKMKSNMGSADRIVRVILAAILAVLYFTNVVTGTLGIVLLVLAVVFLATSIVKFCPLYLPFGISTCKTKES